MARPDPISNDQPTAAAPEPAPLFAVRLWKEELGGGSEYRGSVREVTSGAFRYFRDWSDLVAFMVGRIEGDTAGGTGGDEEVRDVSR